jgi:hypothetical protein
VIWAVLANNRSLLEVCTALERKLRPMISSMAALLGFGIVSLLGLFAALRPQVFVRNFLAHWQRDRLGSNMAAIKWTGWIIFGGAAFTVAAILVAGAIQLSEKRIIKDFQQKHPTYSVLDAKTGEGDSDSAYWYVRYRKPDSDGVFLAVWLYQRENGGKWKVTMQAEPPKPCGNTGEDCVFTWYQAK